MAIKTKEELFGDDAGNGAKVPVSTSAPAGHGPNNRGVAFGEPVTSAVANRMTYALAENDEDLDARIDAHVAETTGAHAASAISITPTPSVFIATNVQAAIDEVGGSIRSHTTETSGAHDASAIYYGGGGNWADGTPNGSTTVEGQLDKIISDLADEPGSAKIGVPDLVGSAISLLGGTLEGQLAQIIAFLNEARPLKLSVDHTTFFNGDDWVISPDGLLFSAENAALINFPIGKPPPGARIDSISVRLDPGGSRSSPNRTKLRLDRVSQDGTITNVNSTTENPAAEGDGAHTWTVTLASPHVWDPEYFYHIMLVSGNDGGSHNTDGVGRIWLNLSYS